MWEQSQLHRHVEEIANELWMRIEAHMPAAAPCSSQIFPRIHGDAGLGTLGSNVAETTLKGEHEPCV
jgi:hypothetical protein